MALLQRLVALAPAPVKAFEVVANGRLVALDGRHDIVGVAFVDQDPRRFLLDVQRVNSDRAP